MPIAKYNWDELKMEFFNSDKMTVMDFVRERGFARGSDRGLSGAMQRKTIGWAEEKKDFIRMRNQQLQLAVDEEAKDKFRVNLELLLRNKHVLYTLDGRYLGLLVKLARGEEKLTPEENAFLNAYRNATRLDDIAKRISMELGNPSEGRLRTKEGLTHGHVEISEETFAKIIQAHANWGVPILSQEQIKEIFMEANENDDFTVDTDSGEIVVGDKDGAEQKSEIEKK